MKDVEFINASLKLLQNVKDREWGLLGVGIVQQSKATFSSCTRAYDLFKTGLQSTDGDIAWISTRFAKLQIKAMSEQLSSCTLTINSIISITNLSIPKNQITKKIKETISTMRAKLESGITTVDKQLIVLEDKLEDLNLSSDEEVAEGEGKVEALEQLKEQLGGLRASQKLLNKLMAKFVVRNSGFQAETINGGVNVWGDGNSGFQAGTINGGVSDLTFGGK
ncbi:hypothetical protein IFR05_016852 [Cadophora sp. M221]|nr:hypothetical protein IFR05_016852 [Cadophora sp. M221]